MKYPKRPQTHEQETASEVFFRRCLPPTWTCEKPEHDYGVDLRVGITNEGNVEGRELLVQLKSSKEEPAGETVPVRLKVATYNYLWDMLPVAMLVKFVESEQEAYFLLLSEIAPPPDNQDSFTVHVPRENRLSASPWEGIRHYVEAVHSGKLGLRVRRGE